MATTPPQLESFFYAALTGLETIRVDDSGTVVSLTNTTAVPVQTGSPNVLTGWHVDANVSVPLAETYTFSWDSTNQQVSFSATGAFDLYLDGSTSAAFGFSDQYHTGASEYTSDLTPKAICNPLNIDYDAPRAAEETELRMLRWSRAIARKHYRAEVTTLRIMMTSAQADAVLAGPLLTSKMRVLPTGYTSGAYSASNTTGYLDVFPYGIPNTQKIGSADGHTMVEIACSVVE